ncbi:MARVEL domain-containing protein 2 [Syngnathoides biaculeatus]|uniref:MARVEL domain-containing protein 2 n=1 Tax=Syngnathoides biaculeatus TaxID=300417 RepID=UPI002ADE4245|nr:MARVEL domain-containing protein 2 [Syngnathoides biaculeatus]XP_061658191.1 MARVEL domain-containing protein 2 [Syngnathoides biaculeatus]XP_061658194.1 MARVEL domain-containing protein 2 [Syngnathoides biaculeatus]XP_061658195.1 MARVEL domain-containing protein 2 [Syngnathoides biaculeatus]XP_061658196.1 MARVEL domain-containing protein 2 [Syngnathoides biaculeatus]XP_061658197.1 MARVEL domain-containing protein 2 [Syngnathoides biaculeatus]XP_061658198.1 MARVEL domain-containing protein
MFHGEDHLRLPAPHYDQVPAGTSPRGAEPHPLSARSAPYLALSADPLPPPPLPDRPPVGPEYPGDGEGAASDRDPDPALDIKPVHRFVPDSWKNFFRASDRSGRKGAWPDPSAQPCNNNDNGTSEGVRRSPSVPGSYGDPYGGSAGSYDSAKELLELGESASGRTYRTALTYSERVEDYHRRYAFMKSWAGLLRILGCVELLLGAAVFACVCAYLHKDNLAGPAGAGFYAASGATYTGPKTAFVLVVVGLAWLVTVIVLVLGMTMYYRTILLDSTWWPLTEFVINLALAVFYVAAGLVYVRDTTRGGLCSYPMFNNGLNGAFCKTEAGQTAAIIFLFLTMAVYLIGAGVSLKLWRHEAARRYRQNYAQQMRESEFGAPQSPPVPASTDTRRQAATPASVREPPVAVAPKILQGAIPSGHIPKPVIVPDYIAKYPTVRSDEERDQYRAVFNDQYAEYKELHADVQAACKKFDEMDAVMRGLPRQPANPTEADRINRILQDFQRKKNDPTFLEKKERCDYLKNKLSHIKQKIHEYDKVMKWNDGYDQN